MLISRLALSLFWFPGVCPLRLEYFVFLKRITGSFSCFRCLIFKVLCAPFSSVKRLTILPHLSMFVNNFFRSFFWRAFQFYHTVSGLSRTFFALPVRNFSILPQPLKVCQDFFPLRLALDYNTTLSSSCQRFFSLFFAFFHGLVIIACFIHRFSTLSVIDRQISPFVFSLAPLPFFCYTLVIPKPIIWDTAKEGFYAHSHSGLSACY